jgi:3-dehydroquinate dehydratase II
MRSSRTPTSAQTTAPMPREPMRFLLLNGPNLNRLGRREPDTYGARTLAEIVSELTAHAKSRGVELLHEQSNHEGALLDFLHEHVDEASAVICNPGGLTSCGTSLRDALADAQLPLGVVHLSSFMARPAPWPREDIFQPLAEVYTCGLGPDGYRIVLDALAERVPPRGAVPTKNA